MVENARSPDVVHSAEVGRERERDALRADLTKEHELETTGNMRLCQGRTKERARKLHGTIITGHAGQKAGRAMVSICEISPGCPSTSPGEAGRLAVVDLCRKEM